MWNLSSIFYKFPRVTWPVCVQCEGTLWILFWSLSHWHWHEAERGWNYLFKQLLHIKGHPWSSLCSLTHFPHPLSKIFHYNTYFPNKKTSLLNISVNEDCYRLWWATSVAAFKDIKAARLLFFIHIACQKLIIKNNSDVLMFLKEVSYTEQGRFFANLIKIIKSSNIKKSYYGLK